MRRVRLQPMERVPTEYIGVSSLATIKNLDDVHDFLIRPWIPGTKLESLRD